MKKLLTLASLALVTSAALADNVDQANGTFENQFAGKTVTWDCWNDVKTTGEYWPNFNWHFDSDLEAAPAGVMVQYILNKKGAEAPAEELNPANLYANATFQPTTFYWADGTGWQEITPPTLTGNNQEFTLQIDHVGTWQWQGQVQMVNNITFSANRKYKFSFHVESDKDIPSMTVKLQKPDNDNVFFVADVVSVPAGGKDYEFVGQGFDSDGTLLIFDMAGTPDNTTVTFSNFSLVETEVIAPEATAKNMNISGNNVNGGTSYTGPLTLDAGDYTIQYILRLRNTAADDEVYFTTPEIDFSVVKVTEALVFKGVTTSDFERLSATTGTLKYTLTAENLDYLDHFEIWAVRPPRDGEEGDQTVCEKFNTTELTGTMNLTNLNPNGTTAVWTKVNAIDKDGQTIYQQFGYDVNTAFTYKATLTYTIQNGPEKAYFNYVITPDNFEAADVESVRVWLDIPGNITIGESNTMEGAIEVNVAAGNVDAWFKSEITLKDGAKINATPNDKGVNFAKTEAAPEWVAEKAFYGTCSGTVADSQYTIEYKFTTTEDHKINIRCSYYGPELIGMVPEMYINGQNVPLAEEQTRDINKNFVGSYDAAGKNAGENLKCYFRFPYANGGILQSDEFDYVIGDTSEPNGINGIFNANAEVEYFNLNGLKVAEPTDGIFIRRQGNTVTKVIIRK